MFATKHQIRSCIGAVMMGLASGGCSALQATPSADYASTQSAIVRAESVAAARLAVEAAGGRVVQEMTLMKAVSAKVTDEQLRILRADQTLPRIYTNPTLERPTDGAASHQVAGPAEQGEQRDHRV